MSSLGGFDPNRAMERLRKLAADAPAHLADGFGRAVGGASPERLEQLMRSPARKPTLDGIFWQMSRQVDPKAAADLQTSIRWCITGRPDGGTDVYQLEIDHGAVKTVKGDGNGDPRLTVTIDAAEFLRLASGNLDPMQAYFKGRIQLAGDIMVAAKLAQLFRIPGTPGGSDAPTDAPPSGSDAPPAGPDAPPSGPDAPPDDAPPDGLDASGGGGVFR